MRQIHLTQQKTQDVTCWGLIPALMTTQRVVYGSIGFGWRRQRRRRQRAMGTRVKGRRRAGWAQRNRHHDGHAVVALHVLALRVGARLPLILAHHHPRIPLRARRQRAATEGQHRRRWRTRTYSTSTSSPSFLLSLVLLCRGGVQSCGRDRASDRGPRQLLIHPQIRLGRIKKRCRCAIEARTATSRTPASTAQLAQSNRARLSRARLDRARSDRAQFDPIAGAVRHTHVHAERSTEQRVK